MNQLARTDWANSAPASASAKAPVFEVPTWGASHTSISPLAIRRLLRARLQRADYLSPTLLGEPGWDMLLEAFACDLEQQRISVSSLIDAASIPQTTGLRWLAALVEEGLLARRDDPLDGRRVFVHMTDKGRRTLEAYFSSLPHYVQPL